MALKDNYFTVSQASEYLGVTRQTISRWIEEGSIAAEKVGREKLISKEELVWWKRNRAYVDLFGWTLWRLVAQFVGYLPMDILAEGFLGKEPLRVTVTDGVKKDLVEVEQEGEELENLSQLKFHKVKKFHKPKVDKEDIEPGYEICLGFGEEMMITKASFRELGEWLPSKDEHKSRAKGKGTVTRKQYT